jgi:hypothetical protein
MRLSNNTFITEPARHAMGEEQGTLFSPECNRSVVVEARRDRLTADAGVLLMRELSERLGMARLIGEHLDDPRDPGRITHPFLEFLRTRLFTLVQGWGDQNDVALLHADPAFRLAVSERRGEGPLRMPEDRRPDGLCSQPTLSRLLHTLASDENRAGLARILRGVVRPFLERARREATVDLDSLPQEVHGHQPGSTYNGHYGVRCYHPLVASVDGRFFLGARLRPGNAHTADGGLDFVLPIVRWLRCFLPSVWLRADAGFPEPRFLDILEDEDIPYVCRLRSNPALESLAAPHLKRPPGRPPAEGRTWFHELAYQADSWRHPRRVVLVVVERPDEQQHLFLDHFFLLTNALPEEACAEALLERYRRRGCAEADFGDCNTALAPSLSSTPRPKSHYRLRPIHEPYTEPDSFAANEAQLLLSYLAANLMAAGAELLHRKGETRISRERFRTFLLKSAGRVLLGTRRVTLVIQAARAHLWQRFHEQLLALPLPRGSPDLQTLSTPA